MPTISKIQNASLPSGSVLQVQYTQLDTPFQVTGIGGGTEIFVTGMSVVITPTRANSIIRLESVLFQEYNQSSYTANSMFYFTRNDSTKLYAPVAGSRRSGVSAPNEQWGQSTDVGSTPDSMDATYFDSTHNSTSALTYKLVFTSLYPQSGTAGVLSVNRTGADTNSNEYERGVSFISATEIAS
tara:strand:- start:88 stop:639 length:552 start_codon:yes stop_codon:yes gene_type:complete